MKQNPSMKKARGYDSVGLDSERNENREWYKNISL